MNRLVLTTAYFALVYLSFHVQPIDSVAIASEEDVEKAQRAEQDRKDASAFAHSRNSLKQLVVAFHNYHDANKLLPAAFSRKADGTKLMSWRVHLLPFLGEDALYAEFHLDEPWDSEHNKKLIPKMPSIYKCPALGDEATKKGLTAFVGPVAPKTIFEGSDAIPLSKIRDGTSNTVALLEVDAEHAVPWTRPDDLKVNWKDPLKGLKLWKVGTRSVFLAAYCDGNILAIADTIEPADLRRLLQKDDREPIGSIP